MAESSIFWTTNGTGDGTGSGYTQAQLFQLMRSFARTSNLGGVSPDVLNELQVTGTATPVSINTGQAFVYGIVYFNTASVTVAISTPAAQTRIDRIVLRASWAAQTVRITRIAGVEGGSAPAITQTPNTTYDIPLAQVSITTGGVITVTDEREWANGVGDLVVDSTKLAANAVTNAKMATMTANTVKANNTAGVAVPSDVDIATLLAAYIHGATAKTTPVNADEFALIDSAASNVLKRVTAANAPLGMFVSSTFTPTLAGSGGSSGITYTTQTGAYQKLGNMVWYTITIVLSSKGSASGTVTVEGLPFTVASSGAYLGPVHWLSMTSSYVSMTALAVDTTTTLALYGNMAAGTQLNQLNFTGLSNSATFNISGWYLAA